MADLTFFQVDVFTSRRLEGNPLAVFPDATGLDARTMQALAREMNLSETTFVTPSESATRRVRFFTPSAEIPLAGHPTIGTWWLLAERGLIDVPPHGGIHVTQETGAGILPVELEMQDRHPSRVVMTQARPEFGPEDTDPASLADALGAHPADLAQHPLPGIVSTALPQLMVPFVSRRALEALPSGGAGGALVEHLRSVGTNCAMCYWLEDAGHDAAARCRMFAPGLGVPEDPATGSAAGALGAYLVRHGLVKDPSDTTRVTVHQGYEIGRASRIDVDVDTSPKGTIQAVRVGGEAVTVIEGRVHL